MGKVYDRIDALPSDESEAAEFLASLAGSGPALELGIGTGRVAIPLAQSANEPPKREGQTLAGHTGTVRVLYAPDGTLATFSDDHTIQLEVEEEQQTRWMSVASPQWVPIELSRRGAGK